MKYKVDSYKREEEKRMTHENAVRILGAQERSLKRLHNKRIQHGRYEYRLSWYGGFAAYVAIDRREIGKWRFEYFDGISAANCRTSVEALNLAMDKIQAKG